MFDRPRNTRRHLVHRPVASQQLLRRASQRAFSKSSSATLQLAEAQSRAATPMRHDGELARSPGLAAGVSGSTGLVFRVCMSRTDAMTFAPTNSCSVTLASYPFSHTLIPPPTKYELNPYN